MLHNFEQGAANHGTLGNLQVRVKDFPELAKARDEKPGQEDRYRRLRYQLLGIYQ